MQNIVNDYLSRWPDEGQRLERGITKADGREINGEVFEDWMKALESKTYHDLPAFKANAAAERDAAVDKHLDAISSEIISYDERVRDMVFSINDLLKDVPYDPAHNTRACLRYDDTADDEINKFRSDLDRIRRSAHTKEPKEVMDALRALLGTVMDNGTIENAGRRKKVMNLANWKDVYVVEQMHNNEGELEDYRTFSGKDGASGGQRERLAMLMLGAAQSYGMGGADPSRTATGLQTIILDEAFLRSSSETAHASTDILSAMGLQVIAATPAEKLGAFRDQVSQIITITTKNHQVKAQPVHCETIFGGRDLDISAFDHTPHIVEG
jgi:uncharacterized protein YPO0396